MGRRSYLEFGGQLLLVASGADDDPFTAVAVHRLHDQVCQPEEHIIELLGLAEKMVGTSAGGCFSPR